MYVLYNKVLIPPPLLIITHSDIATAHIYVHLVTTICLFKVNIIIIIRVWYCCIDHFIV